ncbi:hypothetical protein LSH36_184g01001 [Paralvinella palmiformis]|uniref:Uncharacterized protein n=1 Tax=Paralvinella palmiformis TaxID=53620 RepID=A0AAD9JSH1_9ANNE|nr:hypothetical protein LSH36_184g01001 [Paralvinella palmiformis]
MPLYIRNNVSWTPTSLKEESFQLDEKDFVQDPDLHRDVLPQPYRMVNKLIWSIIDDVWEHVNERESERIADASRLRPPQYRCKSFSELMENLVQVSE